MYKIKRRGGGRGPGGESKNRLLGQTQKIHRLDKLLLNCNHINIHLEKGKSFFGVPHFKRIKRIV